MYNEEIEIIHIHKINSNTNLMLHVNNHQPIIFLFCNYTVKLKLTSFKVIRLIILRNDLIPFFESRKNFLCP